MRWGAKDKHENGFSFTEYAKYHKHHDERPLANKEVFSFSWKKGKVYTFLEKVGMLALSLLIITLWDLKKTCTTHFHTNSTDLYGYIILRNQ